MNSVDEDDRVCLWLGGLSSPPASPRSILPAIEECSLRRKRRHSDQPKDHRTMSRSPPKKPRTAQSATSDAQVSDISLPPLPDRVRPSSPPRELRDIYKYAKPPLKFATSPNENTPAYILELYQGLQQSGVGIIPQAQGAY